MIVNFKRLAAAGAIFSSVLFLTGCNLFKSSSSGQSGQAAIVPVEGSTVTIRATDSGFNPTQAWVKSGGQITWVNNTSKKIAIGSDSHPTHTLNQEISGGKFVLELDPEKTKTVTVTKDGIWGYHDHLNSSVKGTVIIVK